MLNIIATDLTPVEAAACTVLTAYLGAFARQGQAETPADRQARIASDLAVYLSKTSPATRQAIAETAADLMGQIASHAGQLDGLLAAKGALQ